MSLTEIQKAIEELAPDVTNLGEFGHLYVGVEHRSAEPTLAHSLASAKAFKARTSSLHNGAGFYMKAVYQ